MYFRKSNTRLYQLDVQEKKNVSAHSSTESAIILLDAGLRMDGLLVLGFLGCGDRSVTVI